MACRDLRAARALLVAAALVGASVAGGCADGDATDAVPSEFDTPLTTADGQEGHVHVALWRASTQDLTRGVLAFELVVTDVADAAPLDGWTLSVRPWMPAMGHGTAIVPTVAALGDGHYRVTNVSLSMAGHWVLATDLVHGELADHVDLGVDVR